MKCVLIALCSLNLILISALHGPFDALQILEIKHHDLRRACYFNNVPKVKDLLDQGADPDNIGCLQSLGRSSVLDINNSSPLLYFAIQGDALDAIIELLLHNANPDLSDHKCLQSVLLKLNNMVPEMKKAQHRMDVSEILGVEEGIRFDSHIIRRNKKMLKIAQILIITAGANTTIRYPECFNVFITSCQHYRSQLVKIYHQQHPEKAPTPSNLINFLYGVTTRKLAWQCTSATPLIGPICQVIGSYSNPLDDYPLEDLIEWAEKEVNSIKTSNCLLRLISRVCHCICSMKP